MEYGKIQKQRSKRERYETSFQGLNYSENFKEGELEDCLNLSSRMFPHLAPRETMQSIGEFNRPTAIYYWGGLVVVDGTDLIYKGNVVGNVTPGEKQFAVVNTKLCIFPDKKYLDLQYGTLRPLGSSLTTMPNSTTFTTNKITMNSATTRIDTVVSDKEFDSSVKEYVTVYDSVTFNSSTGEWVKTPANGREIQVQDLKKTDITIPYKNPAGNYELRTRPEGGNYQPENHDGVYFQISSVKSDGQTTYKWEKFNVERYTPSGYKESGFELLGPFNSEATGGTFYTFDKNAGAFSIGGGTVTISVSNPGTVYTNGTGARTNELFMYKHYGGTRSGEIYYNEAVKNDSVESQGSISYGYVYGAPGTYPSNGVSGNYWYVLRGDTGKTSASIGYDVYDAKGDGETFSSLFHTGEVVKIEGSERVKESGGIKVISVTDYAVTFEGEPFIAGVESNPVTVYKQIPDLDYICSSDNRLWGVSNKDKTIYASALGLPGDFYAFEGVDTDSYAVAVGSDGDFTGIIRYNNGVCCWKERTMHKIMGSFPSEYQMATYSINGLQDGSNRSMQIINETLYYKGVSGFYSYNGYIPQLISYNFGNVGFRYVVSGADTQRYYISAQTDDGAWGVWCYDTIHQLWLQEIDRRALDFTNQNGKILMLEDDNVLYGLNTASEEKVNWMAEFTPFEDTSFAKRGYTRLELLLEMDKGSRIWIETREDNKPWKRVATLYAQRQLSENVPIRLGRCNRFRVRISGRGYSVIRGLSREFGSGSEV